MSNAGQTIPELVESRGYSAERLFNSTGAAQGQPLKLMGYTLTGPRGNRTVVMLDDHFAAQLWCDGVDYATSKIRARS